LLDSSAIDVTCERGQRRRKVTWREVQKALRETFKEWGLPERLQTDKELVFEGHPADLYPSRFQQWLAGLGIQFERTRPGRPQDQGRVERSHRTLSGFVCSVAERRDLSRFQAALTRNRHLYNHKFPSRARGCHRQPPLQAHPEALIPLRPYQPESEWHLFSLERVAQLLADKELIRKVNATGQISLGGRLYYVGRKYSGQQVRLRFDPGSYTWGVFTQEEQEIKRFQPANFSKSYFLNQYPLVRVNETTSSCTNQSEHVQTGQSFQLLWAFLSLYLQILETSEQEGNVALKELLAVEAPTLARLARLLASQVSCRRPASDMFCKSDFVKVPPP